MSLPELLQWPRVVAAAGLVEGYEGGGHLAGAAVLCLQLEVLQQCICELHLQVVYIVLCGGGEGVRHSKATGG
jgi:hypothetical protein